MKIALAIIYILVALKAFPQSRIEVGLLSTYSNHAKYTSRYFDRSYTNVITISGLNYGLNLNYVRPFSKNLNATVGLGYYRLGIDKVTSTTSMWGTANGRTIQYRHPEGIQPGFYTDKYFYDILNFMLGISYEKKCKNLSYTAGSDINFRYSLSQQYHIDWGEGLKFKTSNQRPFGFGVNSYLGILKVTSNNKYYINPKIVIPIFQRIKGDRTFGEDERIKIDKWFSGFGLSVAFGKYL